MSKLSKSPSFGNHWLMLINRLLLKGSIRNRRSEWRWQKRLETLKSKTVVNTLKKFNFECFREFWLESFNWKSLSEKFLIENFRVQKAC